MSSCSYSGWQNRSGYRRKILNRDDNVCQICSGPATDVDHIIPWDVSHDNSPSNLRALCHRCNVSLRRPRKDALLPLAQWYEQIERELAEVQA